MNTMDNFRIRMKERRESLGITLREIAEEIGVKEATVQRYESGTGIKSVPYDNIVAISKVLKCSPAYLMGWIDNSANDRFSTEGTILAAKVAKNPELKQLITNYESANETGKLRILENAADMARLYPKEQIES